MGADGAGAALTGAALAAAGPEEREHRGGCRESGPGRNTVSCSSARQFPRCLPELLLFARTAPVPVAGPPLPLRDGPEAAPAPGRPHRGRTATPSDVADPVPQRRGSPRNAVPSNTSPPLWCPPTMASAGRGPREPGAEAALPGALPDPRGSLRPSAPSESGLGSSARSLRSGNVVSHRRCSSGRVHSKLFIFMV